MKLDEAIETLELDYQAHHNVQDPVPAIAIRLGIEALKRLIYLRDTKVLHPFKPLPGETKE